MVITASRLLGYDVKSAAHLDLGFFCHSSLQILSGSFRLDGDHWCTDIFRSLWRCLIGYKSGPGHGPSDTFTELSLSHSCIEVFNYRFLCTLLCPVFAQPWPVSPSLPLKNTLTDYLVSHSLRVLKLLFCKLRAVFMCLSLTRPPLLPRLFSLDCSVWPGSQL